MMINSRRSFLKRSGLLTATALGVPHLGESAETIISRPGQKPRRIIMMVSDGMSMGTFTAADHFSTLTRGSPTTWMQLLNQPESSEGLMNMRALNAIVPDSAAASSKWGSGSLVVNGAVNRRPDDTGLKTLCDVLGSTGWQRGLVTTTEITHATPAGFAASVSSRDLGETIAEQYLASRVDVLLGGASDKFDSAKRKDKRDLFADFTKEGYAILRNADELQGAALGKRWLGVFSPSHIPYVIDHQNDAEHHRTVPMLAAMSGVVTEGEVEPGAPLPDSPCTHCMRCVEACPAGALSGGGRVDKRRCGDRIFSGGFREWRRFLLDLLEATPENRGEIAGSRRSLDLWQNFMTGNYYYCFACQASSPVGKTARD